MATGSLKTSGEPLDPGPPADASKLTDHRYSGVLMRHFDRPLTAEIFVVLVWAMFVGSLVNYKNPIDHWVPSASAAVSITFR